MRPIIAEAVQSIVRAADLSPDPTARLRAGIKEYRESAIFWGWKYFDRGAGAVAACTEVAVDRGW